MNTEAVDLATPASSSSNDKLLQISPSPPVINSQSASSILYDRSPIMMDTLISNSHQAEHLFSSPSTVNAVNDSSTYPSTAAMGTIYHHQQQHHPSTPPLLYATPAIIPSAASSISSSMTAAAAPFTPPSMQISDAFSANAPPISCAAPYSPVLFPGHYVQPQGDHGEMMRMALINSSINPLAVFSARTLQLYQERGKEEMKRDKKKQAELNLLLSEEGKEFVSELCRLYSAMVEIPYRNAMIAYDQQQRQYAIESSIPHYTHITTISRPNESVFVESFVSYCHRLGLLSDLSKEAVDRSIERLIECVPHRQFRIIHNLAKKYGVKTLHEEKWYHETEDHEKGSNRRMSLLRTRLRQSVLFHIIRDPHIVHQFINEIDQLMKALIIIENSVNAVQQPLQAIVPPSPSLSSSSPSMTPSHTIIAPLDVSSSSSTATDSQLSTTDECTSIKRARMSEEGENRTTSTTSSAVLEESSNGELSHKSPHRENSRSRG